MTRTDLDAIRARCDAATPGPWGYRNHEKRYLLDETTDVVGEVNPGKTSAAITVFSVASGALEDADFLAHARTDIPALLAYVDELEREIAILRPWSVMLKRAHGALTDAGCVVPLEFDKSIEHAIKDLARRATRAEQLCVDEYDARKAAEREIAELKARITTLEAMKP